VVSRYDLAVNLTRVVIAVLFGALLAGPFLLRPRGAEGVGGARELIIITPHNEQIRYEFARAFERWHREVYGEAVDVVWSVQGGTSDSRRMLEAQYEAALRDGRAVGGSADLFFGGGQYEHDALKRGVSILVDGERRSTSISTPVEFDREWLLATYGGTEIAGNPLFDPEGYWYGTALSSFGIIYNRDVLAALDEPPPTQWSDLARPGFAGWVATGNPSQSGSMRKSFDTVLQHRGWGPGWRVLRRMGANSRYFTASSSTVPIDVSAGDAAAGACIDFYGRFQMQAVVDAGDADRLGYVDPAGETAIDADPVSMLKGAPHPELARRFIRFALTDEAQALWQFPRDDDDDDVATDGLGPERFELRRLPILRPFYERYGGRFIDQVDPFAIARAVEEPHPEYWGFVSLLFNAMVIDNHEELKAAWEAIRTHPAYPSDRGIIGASDVSDPTLRQMLRLFDAMPAVPAPGRSADPGPSPHHRARVAGRRVGR